MNFIQIILEVTGMIIAASFLSLPVWFIVSDARGRRRVYRRIKKYKK
jgi:hypothetical protein